MPNTHQNPKKSKSTLHPRNKNKQRYNFKQLIENHSELANFIIINKFNNESIDFSLPEAVKVLNKAILKTHYNISFWEIPNNYLCPPIPGRADYIHYIADLLKSSNNGKFPPGNKIKCLDIGTGANCIYPIIGHSEYQWSFIGSDIDPLALESANKIIEHNSELKINIECRLQKNNKNVFNGILSINEKVDISLCNPPFHASAEDATRGNLRKLSKLNKKKARETKLNFGGKNNELWCNGGEKEFVSNMILESKQFSSNCFWFSSLVSKQSNLTAIYKKLKEVNALTVETIPMSTGNKLTRIVAWTFLNKAEQKAWKDSRWNSAKTD